MNCERQSAAYRAAQQNDRNIDHSPESLMNQGFRGFFIPSVIKKKSRNSQVVIDNLEIVMGFCYALHYNLF